MSDPLAEAGQHGPVPYLIAFAISAATSVGTAVGGALRFSGRIAAAENEAKTATARAIAAESNSGKLADELRLVRAEVDRLRTERPSAPVSEAEIQRRIAEAVRSATEPLKADTDRLEDEVNRLRDAAERGASHHAEVQKDLGRILGALEREARR